MGKRGMINLNHGSIHNGVIRVDLGQETRRRARKAAQKPGATRKIEDKRRKPPKHSKRWQDDGTGTF